MMNVMVKRSVAAALWLTMFVGMDSMAAALLHAPNGWGVPLGVLSALVLLVDTRAVREGPLSTVLR